MTLKPNKKLTMWPLSFLIIGSIDSIRNMPATAIFGPELITFLVLGALFFLIPTALVSAELCIEHPERGGIYQWVRAAWGPNVAVLAIWFQWINTMVWFPTILSFITATIAYLIHPSWAQHPLYLITSILIIFWSMTLLNLKGVQLSARLATVCTLLGMVTPLLVLITLSLIWLFSGQPLQIDMSPASIWPDWHHASWLSLTAIMTSFLGIELASVHIQKTHQPAQTFRRSLSFSAIVIIITMLLGSLSVAYVIPVSHLNLMDGIMATFHYYYKAYHLQYLAAITGTLIVIGTIGGLINWMISPLQGLLHAAEDKQLPRSLTKTNASGVPYRLMLIQALIVSLVTMGFTLLPTVNASYWLLTDLSTQVYMLMYIFLFLSAYKLFQEKTSAHAIIPGGHWGKRIVTTAGLIGSVCTIVVGFIPPDVIPVGDTRHYELLLCGGFVTMIALGPILFALLKPRP